MKKVIVCGLLVLGSLLAACTGQSDVAVQTGIWRAAIQTPGGELPFGLEIQPVGPSEADQNTPKSYVVYAINGTERLKMDTATVQGDSLRIPMRLFESELVAKVEGKTLQGIWRKRRTLKEYQTLPFTAQHGEQYRFTADTKEPAITVSGKWQTLFRSGNGGDTTLAVGVFEQQGSNLTGTFLTPTGDYRYLAGNVVGDSIFLSTFDGTHAYLFKAKFEPNRTLRGAFWSGASGYETFTAQFNPTASLPNANTLTYLKPGNRTLNFTFPDVNGQPVSLTDERFKGKVTIVQILGSWCPNCMDETNFLSPWYKRNRERGVEIVGLAFEKSADLSESGPKLKRMVNRFGIEYPILLAGTNDKAEASKALPALNRVVGFPTTIFVDKKGNVREIHTGFSGPGTGKYYDEFVEEFNQLVDKLASE